MRTVCLVVLMSVTLSAQAEAPPVLDELAQEYINGVILASQSEQIAFDVLKQTEPYKQYDRLRTQRQDLQRDRLARIEKKYPGFTVDWATVVQKRVLVAKSPSKESK
jgi:hypothetical protein